MIDIKFIRENKEKVKKGVLAKGVKVDIDKLLKIDNKRRELIKEVEGLKAEKNKLGKEFRSEAKKIKDKIKKLEPQLVEVEKEFNDLMFLIPNLPLDNLKKNKVIKKVGVAKKSGKDYLSLTDLIDVKRASKVSGTRFGYLKGKVALLEIGLIQLAIDILKDFTFIIPPVMIKPKMMKAMGYTDRGGDEIYFFPKDNLNLIGTSEQSIGPMHADEILSDLPKRYLAFSTCFRREAGSYGKDTKGILRVHQFDKMEMFSFCKPEDSIKEHKYFLSLQEKLMKLLKIPYQVVQMAGDDLGDPAAAKYDIESWMPGQKEYRETHSTSNCTNFQARRLNIKYRSKKGLEFIHTVNGTAFAMGRTIIAIIENYQQKDGTIKVPQVLQKYIKIKEIK